MRFNWALDKESRKRFVKNFEINEAEGNRIGEIVVYSGAFIAPRIPIKDPAYESKKSLELKTRMEKQVADAKVKKHIYEGKAKRSKRWSIALTILSAIGFAALFSSQYIDAIASYVLPIIDEITYIAYSLAATTVFSLGKAIRNSFVLIEIEKDILVLDNSIKLNEAKADELNLMGLSLRGQATIRDLNENQEQIDVVTADQLKAVDLDMLLQNYELGQKVLTTGQYDRETLGGKVYGLKPKTPRTPRASKKQ